MNPSLWNQHWNESITVESALSQFKRYRKITLVFSILSSVMVNWQKELWVQRRLQLLSRVQYIPYSNPCPNPTTAEDKIRWQEKSFKRVWRFMISNTGTTHFVMHGVCSSSSARNRGIRSRLPLLLSWGTGDPMGDKRLHPLPSPNPQNNLPHPSFTNAVDLADKTGKQTVGPLKGWGYTTLTPQATQSCVTV